MEEEVIGKAYDARIMRRLLAYMKPYRRAVLVSLALLFVTSVLQVLGPLLAKMAIDRYISPVPSRMRTPLDPILSADPWIGLAQISLVYLLAVIGALLCDFGETYLMQWTGQRPCSTCAAN